MYTRFAVAAVVALAAAFTLPAGRHVYNASPEMAAAANTFLATLSGEQLKRARYAMEDSLRTRWHYIPPEAFARPGVTLKELDERQLPAAHALLRAGLSQRGYETAAAIMALERVLQELERGGRFARDADAYYISVFGTPSPGGTWGWRFEGHHLSLHFTVVNGSVTVSTPTFLGASPAEVRSGPDRGRRALAAAEDAAYALLQSLDAAQRGVALLSPVAPADILTETRVPAEPLAGNGLPAGQMTASQQTLLRRLIEAHTALMNDDIAAERWRRIEESGGLTRIGFAWAGATERGRPHYYRVQGPTFVIEYDNTQNDANHVHTVWRDFNGDFGRDLLREHLRSHPH